MEQWVRIVIIGLVLLIGFIFIKNGYRRGLIDSICSLLSIIAGLLSLSFLVMLYGAFQSRATGTIIVLVVLLLVLGVSFKLAKIIMTPLKGLKNLFLLKQLDAVLGAVVGLAKLAAVVWGLNYVLDVLGYGKIF